MQGLQSVCLAYHCLMGINSRRDGPYVGIAPDLGAEAGPFEDVAAKKVHDSGIEVYEGG